MPRMPIGDREEARAQVQFAGVLSRREGIDLLQRLLGFSMREVKEVFETGQGRPRMASPPRYDRPSSGDQEVGPQGVARFDRAENEGGRVPRGPEEAFRTPSFHATKEGKTNRQREVADSDLTHLDTTPRFS